MKIKTGEDNVYEVMLRACEDIVNEVMIRTVWDNVYEVMLKICEDVQKSKIRTCDGNVCEIMIRTQDNNVYEMRLKQMKLMLMQRRIGYRDCSWGKEKAYEDGIHKVSENKCFLLGRWGHHYEVILMSEDDVKLRVCRSYVYEVKKWMRILQMVDGVSIRGVRNRDMEDES